MTHRWRYESLCDGWDYHEGEIDPHAFALRLRVEKVPP
jgi:hypothetical protein